MTFQRILVPVDFSAHSEAAVRAAAVLARKLSGSLIFLHVAPPMIGMIQGEMGPSITPADPEYRGHAEARLGDLQKRFGDGLATEIVVEEGHPWPAICETAEEKKADLVVITSHGYTGLKRMLMGSTAEQVVRHCACPVLVVKTFNES